jgi:hypothetical protein
MGIDKLSVALLTKYEGKNIKDICGNGLTNDADNHCAHFVNHVLRLEFGYTCSKATGKGAQGANVRVHETFARCRAVGNWSDLDGTTQNCLVFITYKSSVDLKNKRMANRPKKHIGIYCNGSIWHYSNTRDKVVKQMPKEFSKHYRGSEFAMFYGSFPPNADPMDS